MFTFSPEFIISTCSAIVAVISAIIAYQSLRQSRIEYQISQTPILIPSFRKLEDIHYEVNMINNHVSGIAKDVSISLEGGKLENKFAREGEFLPKNMGIRPIKITGSLDGANYSIHYKNVFGGNVCLTGRIHEISPGNFDYQDMNLIIENITGKNSFLRNLLP